MTDATKARKKQLIDWQHEFYKGQPAGYRAQWWWWALSQPNFTRMVQKFKEADETVLRSREQAIAEYGKKAQNNFSTR